jgi:hypothetical protein
MKAYVVATGAYTKLATVTARCLEWASGLDVVTIDVAHPIAGVPEAEWPFAAKCLVNDPGQHVVADADLLFMRKFEVPTIQRGTFAGVKAEMYEGRLQATLDKYGGDPSAFVNTGLFVTDETHHVARAQAVAWMRDGVSVLHEESLLNIALQKRDVPIQYLDPKLNRQRITSVYDTGLHLCGKRGLAAKLKEVHYLLQHHAPAELRRYLTERGVDYGQGNN